jgi:PAS domain S-box-containing protein
VAESESLNRSLTILEGAPIGFAIVAPPGVLRWGNRAYFRLTGVSADLVGTDFHAEFPSDGTWTPLLRAAVDQAMAAGSPASFPFVPARSPYGVGTAYLDVDVRPLSRGSDGTSEVLLMVRDVTERVEEHERARIFYEAFRGSTNAMQLTDAEGVMIDVNPAFERIYSYSRQECLGRRPNLVRSHFTPAEVYEEMWTDLTDPQRGSWSGELLNRDRLGRERPVLLSITAIRNPAAEVTHYLGVAVDLSEQRDWELRAAHSQKLASVGQLAAGVAHEINTPLANVMLITESLRRRTTDPELTKRLESLQEQADIASKIVRNLLDFARRQEPQPTDIDLVDIARDAVRFLRGKHSQDVVVDETYPEDGAPISGDRGQLIQVVTNLLNNAFDATGGTGKIGLTVRRAGRWAELEVLDNGPGLPAAVQAHLFEPFFTTKPEGQGTGLGLAICHGIIQSHYGSIRARNIPGAGASFLITLPLQERPAAAAET